MQPNLIITHQRDKLINAVIYFVQNTPKCGKVKLFKLLYFLDFEHYQETGRSVTGLEYHAWRMGPVPVALFEEFEVPAPDLKSCLQIGSIPVKDGEMFKITPLTKFDDGHFSQRELRIMKQLAEKHAADSAEDMIEATHLENSPWHRVYEQEEKKYQPIPYEYVLSSEEDFIRERSQEHSDMMRNYA